jgi:dolichyl-phosphate-mannose--protein O-mannosyl transferase
LTGLHTALRSNDPAIGDDGPARWLRLALVPWAGAVAVTGAAWAVRAVGITTDYNIFVDETTYTRIADNLAAGRGVTLYGTPFDLHPPGGFALMAAAIKIFAMHGDLAAVLFDLRPFVALLGALTCALSFVLVGRLTTWPTGFAVAAIAALDPFEILYDSRVMLEAPGQLAAIGSIVLLVMAADSASERRSWLLACCAGLAGGLALCVK